MRGSKTTPSAEAVKLVELAANPLERRVAGQALEQFNKNGFNPAAYLRGGSDRVAQALNTPSDEIMAEVSRILSMPAKEGAEYLLTLSPAEQEAVKTIAERFAGLPTAFSIAGKKTGKELRKSAPLVLGGTTAVNASQNNY